MTISLNARVAASKDQVSTAAGDDIVILGLADGIYYGLNEVGRRVWELLKVPTTPNQICEIIAQEYEVSADTCRDDVLKLLDELYEHGLISIEDAGIAKA